MAHQLPPVDDDVFEALQFLAEPLVDDINTVLRRLLGLIRRGKSSRPHHVRAVRPASTPP